MGHLARMQTLPTTLLLSCNYDARDFENVPSFYKDILLFFHELKALHRCQHGTDTILFNTEIHMDDRPFFMEGMVRERY